MACPPRTVTRSSVFVVDSIMGGVRTCFCLQDKLWKELAELQRAHPPAVQASEVQTTGCNPPAGVRSQAQSLIRRSGQAGLCSCQEEWQIPRFCRSHITSAYGNMCGLLHCCHYLPPVPPSLPSKSRVPLGIRITDPARISVPEISVTSATRTTEEARYL